MKRQSQDPTRRQVSVELEGEPVSALEGEPVAASLMAAGESVLSRSIKYHRPRGAFCFAGECSHCLMRVDGVPNIFTCRTPAREGMRLERQNAYPSAKVDIFSAIDWLFPHGLDHHEMFAGVPVAEKVMAKVARHLAGLGLLPETPAPERPPAKELRFDILVVGAGPAGLGAALALTEAGANFCLLDQEPILGGRLQSGPLGPDDPAVPPRAVLPKDAVLLETCAIGLYEDEGGWFVAAVQGGALGPRVLKLRADRFLLATGGHAQLPVFEGNDLPGIFAGRAASRLLRRHRLLVGEQVALVGEGSELYALASLLEAGGAKVVALVDSGGKPPATAPPLAVQGTPHAADGRSKIGSFSFLEPGKKKPTKVKCDALVLAYPPSPSFELPRQGGANVNFDQAHRAFVVEADADGRTRAHRVLVAGEVTGAKTAAQSFAQGQRAAATALQGAK